MKIKHVHSHLNGHEYLLVHHPDIWKEIEYVIGSIDASLYITKLSKEKRKNGQMLYSPGDIIAPPTKQWTNYAA